MAKSLPLIQHVPGYQPIPLEDLHTLDVGSDTDEDEFLIEQNANSGRRISRRVILILLIAITVSFLLGYGSRLLFRTTTSPTPPPPSSSPEPSAQIHVIASAVQSDSTAWLTSLSITHNITSSIYIADNTSAPLHTPTNKGHEGMAYLTYIIDNYSLIPSIADIFIFLHAHRTSWHNNNLHLHDARRMLSELRPSVVINSPGGYFNLRCEWDPGCPDYLHPLNPVAEGADRSGSKGREYLAQEKEIADNFGLLFPGVEVPRVLSVPCCAQFAVTREAVLRHDKSVYERIRKWLLGTELNDAESGRVLEYLWHWVMTGGTEEVCVEERKCYCDGYGIC